MAVTPVPAVAPVPPFPALSDRTLGTYNSKAYAFGTHMSVVFMADLLALVNCVKSNAQLAYDSAEIAEAQTAAFASGVAGSAEKWVSGEDYPAGSTAWSPLDKQTYRRNEPGGISNVDPALDSGGSTSGWTRVSGGDLLPQFLLMNQGIV